MSLLTQIVGSWSDPDSLGNRMRSRRLAVFESLLNELPRPLRILDIGGTPEFWQLRGWHERPGVHITVVNLFPQSCELPNVTAAQGDATDLHEFADQSFDVVFSNSVIEHVGDFGRQRRMASEVIRLARAYWVQTPNYWFPIEPHFLFPGWQWLPEDVRVAMLRRRAFGWNGRCPEPRKAREIVRHAQLLSRRQLQQIFPGGKLLAERFYGLVKSWVVCNGFRWASRHNVQDLAVVCPVGDVELHAT